MRNEKVDRRTKYTKMMTKQALLELIVNQPLSKITVTDICNRADINRGTFYKYYSDPYDLLQQIENELFLDIKNIFQKSLSIVTNYDFLVQILEYIAKNSSVCKVLFITHGDKDFISRILQLAHDKTIMEYRATASDATIESLEMLYIFISNGIVGITQNWIQNDMKQDPKELAELIIRLNSKCTQFLS